MRRFLGLWLLVGVVLWIVVTPLDYVVLHAIDWRFEPFCEAVLIPAIQAAALAVALAAPGKTSGRGLLAAARERGILPLAAAGAAVLAAGWLADPASALSLSRPRGVPNLWFCAQIAAAAALGAGVALRRAWTPLERTWLLLACASALAVSARQVAHWAGTFSDTLPLGSAPFLRGLAVELAFLGAVVGLALKASAILGRAYPLSGAALEASTLFPVAAATVVAINLFERPRVAAPWSAVTGSLLLTGAFLVLASSILAWRAGQPAEETP